MYGGERGAYRVLVGKPEGKRSLVRPRHRWDDNIKMDLQEVKWRGGGAWTGLIWHRRRAGGGLFVNAVTNLWVPSNAGNFLTS
jgi:hypothetical protein